MNTLPFSVDQRLRSQYLSLEEMTGSLTDEQLRREVIPGKWSAADNIAHLAVFHDIFKQRILRILNENEPAFPMYVWEEDKLFDEYRNLPNSELLEIYKRDRKIFLALIDTIPAEAYSRYGIHARYGKFTLANWVELFLLHESHHLFTIFRLIHFPA